ncbi:MAG: ankyrin repeat domain-containing protein [Rhodothermaceae bacterium]|nr:ankyrin repeat domain-containing protein [Rhodothermaceae bacterium]
MRLLIIALLAFIPSIGFSQPVPDAPSAKYILEAITNGDNSLITRLCAENNTLQNQRFERKKQTALHVAAAAYQNETIRILVSQCGLDPNAFDNTRTPPIYYARMNPRTVSIFLELGADPNQLIKHAPIPVISQFLINIVPLNSLALFLQHDVDLTLKSSLGMTPLLHAIIAKRKENVAFLLEAMEQGFDIAPDEELNGKRAIEFASPEIAALLTAHGIK